MMTHWRDFGWVPLQPASTTTTTWSCSRRTSRRTRGYWSPSRCPSAARRSAAPSSSSTSTTRTRTRKVSLQVASPFSFLVGLASDSFSGNLHLVLHAYIVYVCTDKCPPKKIDLQALFSGAATSLGVLATTADTWVCVCILGWLCVLYNNYFFQESNNSALFLKKSAITVILALDKCLATEN